MKMEGIEVPLAAWRVHSTELYQPMKSRELAKRHLALSRDTIMKVANSLPSTNISISADGWKNPRRRDG